jgi:hypothetical protein
MEKNMHLTYYESKNTHYREWVYQQMKEQREEAINAIGKLVCRHDISESFAKILSSAYDFGCPEAAKIADILSLDQMDFISIEENLEEYEEQLNKLNEARMCAAME